MPSGTNENRAGDYAAAEMEIREIADALKHASGETLYAAKLLAKNLGYEAGMLYQFYAVAIGSGVAPLLIFMGVGALTDFSALIAKPSTLLLGAAAQFGIFFTLIGALVLNAIPGFDFTLAEASAIAIIGSQRQKRRNRVKKRPKLPRSVSTSMLVGR